jgi:hypothetical protein
MGQTATTVIFVLVIIGMLVLTIILQGWRTNRSPMGKVIKIFKDVKYNEKLTESTVAGNAGSRFRTASWDRHKESVGFLPEELLSLLGKLFAEMEEINRQIDESTKLGSRGYAGGFNSSRLQTNLADAREKLREWIQANIYNRDYLPKKIGLFRWR